MNEHLKGHKSLAEMVSTHIHIWREGLGLMAMNDGYDQSYVAHEQKALADIEAACKVEQDERQFKQVGTTGTMPGTDGFTMVAFAASDVPIGTTLYIAEKK